MVYPIGRKDDGDSFCISFSSVGSVKNDTRACKIDMLSANAIDISNYDTFTKEPIYGCLGLIRIASGIFFVRSDF